MANWFQRLFKKDEPVVEQNTATQKEEQLNIDTTNIQIPNRTDKESMERNDRQQIDDVVIHRERFVESDAKEIIADKATKVEYGAFALTRDLEKVTLAPGANIAMDAFACSGVQELASPLGNTDWRAFNSCEQLRSVSFDDSAIKIGSQSFKGCVSLESVAINDGMQSIGPAAFDGCRSLKTIEIPSSVTEVCQNAFHGCDNLTIKVHNAELANQLQQEYPYNKVINMSMEHSNSEQQFNGPLKDYKYPVNASDFLNKEDPRERLVIENGKAVHLPENNIQMLNWDLPGVAATKEAFDMSRKITFMVVEMGNPENAEMYEASRGKVQMRAFESADFEKRVHAAEVTNARLEAKEAAEKDEEVKKDHDIKAGKDDGFSL